MKELKRTSLYQEHQNIGAKIVEFGGWLMPVQYTGIIEEHRAVRSTAGIFDVSHMGELKVSGPDSLGFLQFVMTNNLANMSNNQARYTLMCNERGGVVDDLIIYRLENEEFWLVVNAGNKDKDLTWLNNQKVVYNEAQPNSGIHIHDISGEIALLALQGPRSASILSGLIDDKVKELKNYHFMKTSILGFAVLVSRTGYSGEDGFEIYVEWTQAPALWRQLLENGKSQGLLPCGLGARDTLRLEACLPLYGHELNEDSTPLEAGLGFFVKFNKGPFIGQKALEDQKEKGIERKLVGFKMLERGIPRAGYQIQKDGITIGEVTSGSYGPTIAVNLGLGYVRSQDASVGNTFGVIIRDKSLSAEIVEKPFYKKEV